jgi:hypothetical protein
MTEAVQQSLIDQLRPVLSDGRVGTYLTAAGFDEERALRLYVWNALVGEAFHLPIQAVEVGLRNRVSNALTALYGPDWWSDAGFLKLLQGDRERLADIETAKRRINGRGSPLVTGQVVATLSFGFWVGMLQPRYNPDVWSRQLRLAFLSFPTEKSRYDLAASAKRVADLRNRIWHHEPIFRMNLLEEFSGVMELLSWVCPIKAAWIKPQCRVPGLMRQKP